MLSLRYCCGVGHGFLATVERPLTPGESISGSTIVFLAVKAGSVDPCLTFSVSARSSLFLISGDRAIFDCAEGFILFGMRDASSKAMRT